MIGPLEACSPAGGPDLDGPVSLLYVAIVSSLRVDIEFVFRFDKPILQFLQNFVIVN